MIVVVADTSPLNYLVQIGCERALPALYERVFLPPVVLRELRNPCTPEIVKQFNRLSMGGRIWFLWMKGWACASPASVASGSPALLGVLPRASIHGLVEIESALARLQSTDFRRSPGLIAQVKQIARSSGL